MGSFRVGTRLPGRDHVIDLHFQFLRFLAEPAFVIPWYTFGAIGAALVLRDTFTANRQVAPALKAAWPIIVLFFSVVGVGLYLWSCRPRHIGAIRQQRGAEGASSTHHEYVVEKWKKVVGSDIHCVAGDGLGIVTAMIVMRLLGFGFWAEFWIEYVVGFAFGLVPVSGACHAPHGDALADGNLEGRPRRILLDGDGDAGHGPGHALPDADHRRTGTWPVHRGVLGSRDTRPTGRFHLYVPDQLVVGDHRLEARDDMRWSQ